MYSPFLFYCSGLFCVFVFLVVLFEFVASCVMFVVFCLVLPFVGVCVFVPLLFCLFCFMFVKRNAKHRHTKKA